MFAAWKLEGRPEKERRERPYTLEVEVCDAKSADGKKLIVAEIGQTPAAIGTCVWDGSLVAAHWLGLAPQADRICRGKRVVDLGAGTGILSILAGKMGASHVLVTDLEICLPLIRENIVRNKLEKVAEAAELDLSKSPSKAPAVWKSSFDAIFIGEVMYLAEVAGKIAEWCDFLLAPGGSVVMAWGRNAQAEPGVLSHLRERNFDVYMVPVEEQHPKYHASDCHLCEARRTAQ